MLIRSSVTVAILSFVVSVRAAPAALTAVTTPALVPLISNGPAIASGLKMEPSVVNGLTKLLTDSSGNILTGDALRQLTVFDFNNQAPAAGSQGGSILLATVDNFPILQELGISGAVSFIEPCGLNIPHWHNRADEILTVVEGVLDTGFVQENGFLTEIETQLGKYQATVFPMGSVHYQQNPTCSSAVFVAGLNNQDPGRSDIATSFWALPSDLIDAALGFPTTIGGDTIDAWRSHLPVNLAAGVDSCLQACGLTKEV
ncbi:RmlC-like cupin domain-containing protein [Mycena maculata]|uniref:RmlC-like cupin domain-containing protein n=1 Tax=Mycena maculata TaxID=230809 RepID=A0AAD7IQZ8_9AGAR|nr:RmlC-like cupin domain-containing protein [Mycena maculata]